MYRRRTKQERHERRVMRFEYSHPKNKYVIRRQAERAWHQAMVRRLATECMVKLAAEGDPTARMMLFAMSLSGAGAYYL